MKKIGVISFFIFSFIGVKYCYAQSWDTVGGGIGVNINDSRYYYIKALCVYNGKLVVGGFFDTVGRKTRKEGIAEWNGSSWDTALGKETYDPTAFLIYNNNLVALGEIILDSNYSLIGQWNGSNWSIIGSGIRNIAQWGYVGGLCEYAGDLYVGGSFYFSPIYKEVNMAMYNGTGWDTVPYNSELYVLTMAVYNNKLYYGGAGVLSWNDTTLSNVGRGVNGTVEVLMVFNGKLYAAGSFDSAGGKPAKNIAVWDGTSWSALGSGTNNIVFSLGTYNNNLIAGGAFDTAGGLVCNKIAQWNGTQWSALGRGIGTSRIKNEQVAVYALCEYNGYLYVGGTFDSAGGKVSYNIARWGSPLSDTIKNYSGPFMIYPNPSKGIYTVQIPSGSGQTTIKIYNVLGQEINSTLLIPTPGADFEINLSNYSAGIYPYRVTAANGSIIGQGKLIIQK